MGGAARLNLLLTPMPSKPAPEPDQPWHKTLSHLLVPLGVRTFEASTGEQAMELIERHPIHVAVVDTRLPAMSGMHVLQLIQRLREQPFHGGESGDAASDAAAPEGGDSFRVQWQVEQRFAGGHRRIEVRFDARPAQPRPGPAVILIAPPAPQQDPQLLQDALKFNAFSVLSEPVDVNLALEVLARALKRFHRNQWPA